MEKVYLDYASTTPLHPKVLELMLAYFGLKYGNPSSLHSLGREARQAIYCARKEIAEILGCSPQEIIFTGSGTESNNLAIFGVSLALKKYGNHIITSSIEHPAVLEPCRELEKEGFKVSYAPVDKDGILDINFIKKEITENTILISVMYANNEIGTIQPIKELGKIVLETREQRKRKRQKTPIYFHSDACQAAAYLPLNVQELKVDLLSINGSKIYGPKGIGVLYVRKEVEIKPLILGGGQEFGLRSGTENVPAIVGMAQALKIVQKERVKESQREQKLRDYFISQIIRYIPGAILNGHPIKRLPNNVNIYIPGIEGDTLLFLLDKAGISVSLGSACHTQKLEPSHVILALGRSPEYAKKTLRFTLGRQTKKHHLDYVVKVLREILKKC